MKNMVTKAEIDALLASAKRSVTTVGAKTTLVVVTLPNGFEIAATSACVDPANYDMAVGEEIAMKRIEDKLWELEGYRLQCSQPAEALDFKDRVRLEKAELGEKIKKLEAFIGTESFCALPNAEQDRMNYQLAIMRNYLAVLYERIAAF